MAKPFDFKRGYSNEGLDRFGRPECINPFCTSSAKESGEIGLDQCCPEHLKVDQKQRTAWLARCEYNPLSHVYTKKPWYFNPQDPLYKNLPTKIEYSLSEDQAKRVVAFWNYHTELHGMYAGAIGGRFTWKLTDTSLGTVIKNICACGDMIDLSDYTDW